VHFLVFLPRLPLLGNVPLQGLPLSCGVRCKSPGFFLMFLGQNIERLGSNGDMAEFL